MNLVYSTSKAANIWVHYPRSHNIEPLLAQIFERVDSSGKPILVLLYGEIEQGRRIVKRRNFAVTERRAIRYFLAGKGFLPTE